MIDAEDGKVDISDYLSEATGYLPVPIIITEPAVGVGAGAAVAYFHSPKDIDHSVPPPPGPSLCFSSEINLKHQSKVVFGAAVRAHYVTE